MGIKLVTTVKKNMKRVSLTSFEKAVLRRRSLIETVFDQLKNLCQVEHTRHRSDSNFAVNLMAGIVAYCLSEDKPTLSLIRVNAFKGDLSLRPVHHQTDARIEAHIFVAFMAYCLQVTLKHRLRALAPGLTPRAVLEKMAALQMVDVHLPTTDGRCLVLSRHTQPEKDQQLLLAQLKLVLPPQPPPQNHLKRTLNPLA